MEISRGKINYLSQKAPADLRSICISLCADACGKASAEYRVLTGEGHFTKDELIGLILRYIKQTEIKKQESGLLQ